MSFRKSAFEFHSFSLNIFPRNKYTVHYTRIYVRSVEENKISMEKTTLYRRICIRGLKLLPSHIILSQYCDTLLELNVFCVATKESKQKCTSNKLKLIANEIEV